MVTLADLLAEPEGVREPWFVEPKDKDAASEERRQQVALADLAKVAPTVTAWAVPNAGKRTRWAAAKAKREGMRKGVLDLTLAWPGGVAFVEFKNGKTMPSEDQEDLLDDLFRKGHHCGVFRTSAGLLSWLSSIGAPIRGRI